MHVSSCREKLPAALTESMLRAIENQALGHVSCFQLIYSREFLLKWKIANLASIWAVHYLLVLELRCIRYVIHCAGYRVAAGICSGQCKSISGCEAKNSMWACESLGRGLYSIINLWIGRQKFIIIQYMKTALGFFLQSLFILVPTGLKLLKSIH